MALFKIFKGLKDDLHALDESGQERKVPLHEGYCYFTTDDGKLYIDAVSPYGLERICLNSYQADYAMRINCGGGHEIGNSTHPIFLNSDGEPKACDNVLGVGISGGLFNETGQAINSFIKPEDEGKKPVYFRDGQPIQCDDTLDVNISGNAVTSTNADFATHATEAESAIVADGAYFLLDLNNPQVSLNTGNQKLPVYFNDGVPVECEQFLPLSAGKQYKIKGPLGLTVEKNYGSSFPSTGNEFEGQLFFIEDKEKIEEELYYLPKGGTEGQALIKNSEKDGDASWLTMAQLVKLTGDVTGEATLSDNAICSITTIITDNSHNHIWSNISDNGSCTINTTGTITGSKVYGAVWNDYAEYRNQKEIIEPGYCVASADNGQVHKTTEKFQACDGIVSDTFGFAIGETDECKTPLAVAGRVLAYCEGNRYNYHSGDTVCAGPNGKVCKMTRKEIQEWPDRIVGIVSEIPEYEYWGSGNISVNERIWIKIK